MKSKRLAKRLKSAPAPRGRSAKGESRTSLVIMVRLSATVAAAAQRKAKRQHCTLHAAIRAAVTAWAMA